MRNAKWTIGAVCAIGAVLGAAGSAGAQGLGSLFPFLNPSPPPAATGSVANPSALGTQEWSGQSGSSGHALMTSQAIVAAASDFPNCLERLWPDAARRGVTRATFDTYTRGLTPDLRIMDLMDTQPEFTKAFWEYLDLLVSDSRIKEGQAILGKYRDTFDAVEKAYGVDRHIVTAIWGIEFEIRDHERRPPCDPLDGNARLRRPQASVFPRRIPRHARNPQSRRCRARSPEGLMGGRFRADPVHADIV